MAKALRTVGVSDLIETNRTRERSEALVGDLGGMAIPFEDIAATPHDVDIVITATDSPQNSISYDMASLPLARRSDRPFF